MRAACQRAGKASWPGCLKGSGGSRPSRNDFQRRDLVAFEFEEIPKVCRAPAKVPDQMAGDDRLSILLFAPEGFARVFILAGASVAFSVFGDLDSEGATKPS
jgi:hypothetical protein